MNLHAEKTTQNALATMLNTVSTNIKKYGKTLYGIADTFHFIRYEPIFVYLVSLKYDISLEVGFYHIAVYFLTVCVVALRCSRPVSALSS